MTISLKNTKLFKEKHDFRGCGFFKMFENLDVRTFDHCILYCFMPGFWLWQQGIVSTTQKMVYDQITYFIKNSIFYFFVFFWKSRFLDFWPLYPIQLFAGIFTVATRNWFDEANDGLWSNYIFYKIFDFFDFFSDFCWGCKKPGKI